MKATFTILVLVALGQLLAACSLFPKHRAQTAWKHTYRTMTLIVLAQGMDGDSLSAEAVAQAVHQQYPEAPFVDGKIVDAWGRPIRIAFTRAVIDAWGLPIPRRTPRAGRGICVHLRSAGPDGIEHTADDILRDVQSDTKGPCPPVPVPANARTF